MQWQKTSIGFKLVRGDSILGSADMCGDGVHVYFGNGPTKIVIAIIALDITIRSFKKAKSSAFSAAKQLLMCRCQKEGD